MPTKKLRRARRTQSVSPDAGHAARKKAPAQLRREMALSIFGDEPGILVQRPRINVQLRGTRTFYSCRAACESRSVKAKVRRAERAREEQAADLARRAAMFWMLHEAGASYGVIARGAGLSPGRVRQVCQDYAYQLHRRSEYVTGREPFMERLRRAGALMGAAERDEGRILKLRFESRAAASIPLLGWPGQQGTNP